MNTNQAPALKIAVSSRALFNLEDGHLIFQREGIQAFDAYMRKNEKKPLRPGVAFSLVQKLLALKNSEVPGVNVDVELLSSITLDAGARVMNSVRHYGLNIERAFFTAGSDRFKIAKAGNVTLFLSSNPQEVRKSLALGIASAQIVPHSKIGDESEGLRVAFDGDAVLWSDESERINQEEGLAAFTANEQLHAKVPLNAGPFKPVLAALHDIQAAFQTAGVPCPLRVALITARGVPVYERVLKTFRHWKIKVDETYFLAGQDKGPFLEAFQADLFFDDAVKNINSASQYVPAGHVPNGVVGSNQAVVQA